MKIRNLITGALTSICAVACISATASAYDLNTDLSIFWSANTTVPGTEFIGVQDGAYVTITYTVDKSLADMAGHDYWCIKPMINDSGWPLIDGITELTTSEAGDSYVIDPDSSSITFTIPEAHAEHVEVAGVAFMGHGIKLETLTVSDEAPITNTPSADTDKTNADTGVEDIAGITGIAAISAAAMAISRKRK